MIAGINTFALLNAQEYVYSAMSDFPWLNESGRVTHDWKTFSKKALLEGIKVNQQCGLTVRTVGNEPGARHEPLQAR